MTVEFLLDFGQRVDMLTKRELEDALATDAANRALIAGVKEAEVFYNLGTIGANAIIYTTPVNMIGNGYTWSVMTIGAEMSASVGLRVYKGVPNLSATNAPLGGGRCVGNATAASTPVLNFSKGQLVLRGGDQLTLVVSNTANFILSAFIGAIEIPTERQGELWI